MKVCENCKFRHYNLPEKEYECSNKESRNYQLYVQKDEVCNKHKLKEEQE